MLEHIIELKLVSLTQEDSVFSDLFDDPAKDKTIPYLVKKLHNNILKSKVSLIKLLARCI